MRERPLGTGTVALIAADSNLALATRVVAAAARRRADGQPTVVCWWGPDGSVPERIGNAHVVRLPSNPSAARSVVEAACAGAEPGPLLVAVGSARPIEFDALLGGADVLIVAWRTKAERFVAELALACVLRPRQVGGLLELPEGLEARLALRGLIIGPAVDCACKLIGRGRECHAHGNGSEALHAVA